MSSLFEKNTFTWIAIIFSLLYLGMMERTWNSRQFELQNTINSNIDLVESSIKSSIYHYDALTRTVIDLEIQQPAILEIIQKANQADETEKNRLRTTLQQTLQPVYEALKQKGIRQLHFHLPDGESFLRMHQPDQYGDHLFDARYSVYLANTQQKPLKGFEEGKIFNGYRFIYPLKFQGKHIGSVETSVGYDHIGGALERIKPYHSYYIFDKKLMSRVLFSKELENFQPSYFSDDYLHEHNQYYQPDQDFTGNTHEQNPFLDKQTFQTINAELKSRVQNKLARHQRFYECISLDHFCWMILFTPIESIKKESIGYIVTYIPNEASSLVRQHYRYAVIGLSGAFVLIMLLLWYGQQTKKQADKQAAENSHLLSQVLESEEELRQLNETLELRVKHETEKNREKDHALLQQSRLAAMGEMIGNIAHQWRQPLNALGLLISKLGIANEHGKLSDSMLDETVQKGERLVQQMSRTIDDFRHFFRPDKTKKVFIVQESIQSAVILIDASLKTAQITLEIEMPEDAVEAFGFPNELSQVLLNLLGNAKDAIKENQSCPGIIRIALTSNEQSATISIEDNGGGIPDGILTQIFDPYFSTKEPGKGTGIGLYMSRQIIENNMDGSIIVTNTHQGVCFSILIPLAPPPSE